ncbi:hypothetical protein [Porphyromonas sp.]|uniref:hypothetical protein n=1 Tax=Porphyromonas sp. TaxID=1924944 RepID=UPI0026DC2AA1|nr:hypothetical protein [Porphyromonas sp.]MDO4695793.1 hypothetical protein [Porphyromonas sp.]MDO4770552.1 hypothetical protein [Porphyromonas sp.]
MHKLEFELKQHTPIIHFQATDDGATLRASEVKPKLDRFLLRAYEKKIPQSTIKNGTEKGHHPSLDFKIKFIPHNTKRISADRTPMYFGNLKSKKPKQLIFSDNGVRMIILVKDETLKKLIEENMARFFLLHNFGSRQSKGYGSFTIKDEKISNIRSLYKYSFDIKTTDYNNVLKSINYFYKSLRSGINEYRSSKDKKLVSLLYFKSAFHYYATTHKGKQWDKRSIKQHFFPEQLKKEEQIHKINDINRDDEKYDFRDLLGLSTNETWKQFNISKTCRGKDGKEINRLKSPIQFKPIFIGDKCVVFFDVFTEDTGFEEFLGSKVFVNAFKKEKGEDSLKEPSKPIKEPLEMIVPRDIKLNDILDYIFSNIDVEKRIAPIKTEEGKKIFEDIKRIYTSLKK